MSGAALYISRVAHIRHKPVRHRLSYRALYVLLDLDRLAAAAWRPRLFSVDRFNLVSFHAADHGDGSATPLRLQVERQLRRAGITRDDGAIRLLCMPRILGWVFNPLSVYFCHRADGGLAAILYEVNNTFGERHSYLIPIAGDGRGVLRQSCAKNFYVSPFMPMDLTYRFRLAAPDDKLAVAIDVDDANGPVLTATLDGARQELSDGNLWRAFLRHPLLAMQVMGGIHWEALKLWRKGLRLRQRPRPPADPVSIAPPPSGAK